MAPMAPAPTTATDSTGWLTAADYRRDQRARPWRDRPPSRRGGPAPEMACGAGHDETEGGRPERAPDHPAQEVLHGPRPALRMGGRRERERDEGAAASVPARLEPRVSTAAVSAITRPERMATRTRRSCRALREGTAVSAVSERGHPASAARATSAWSQAVTRTPSTSVLAMATPTTQATRAAPRATAGEWRGAAIA